MDRVNIRKWCRKDMELTPKETRFIINYLRHIYDDESIGSHSQVERTDLMDALEVLKQTDLYDPVYWDQYGLDIDEHIDISKYLESVSAGESGISDAAPENIVNLEENKKKCKGKNCKDSDDDDYNDDLIDVGLKNYGGRRYGGKIDNLINEFIEKEFSK